MLLRNIRPRKEWIVVTVREFKARTIAADVRRQILTPYKTLRVILS